MLPSPSLPACGAVGVVAELGLRVHRCVSRGTVWRPCPEGCSMDPRFSSRYPLITVPWGATSPRSPNSRSSGACSSRSPFAFERQHSPRTLLDDGTAVLSTSTRSAPFLAARQEVCPRPARPEDGRAVPPSRVDPRSGHGRARRAAPALREGSWARRDGLAVVGRAPTRHRRGIHTSGRSSLRGGHRHRRDTGGASMGFDSRGG